LEKRGYGSISLPLGASLFDNLNSLAKCSQKSNGTVPLPSFEDLKHDYGFLVYTSNITTQNLTVTIPSAQVHDRVQIFKTDHFGHDNEIGVVCRASHTETIAVPNGPGMMRLLVENMGRIDYGRGMAERNGKGYLAKPPVQGTWESQCLPLDDYKDIQDLDFSANFTRSGVEPVFRRGVLQIAGDVADTFLDTRGFHKGYIWVNGRNIGRYWEDAGPQHTLYVPASFLKTGDNDICVLDLHGSSSVRILSVENPRWTPTIRGQDQAVSVLPSTQLNNDVYLM
jgi:hypothetical protein